jgi:hypothetical protein
MRIRSDKSVENMFFQNLSAITNVIACLEVSRRRKQDPILHESSIERLMLPSERISI